MLFIGSKVVIDNSTWKWGPWEENGRVNLEAGKHEFVLTHVHTYPQGQSPHLELFIEGPGIDKQLIPSGMFYRNEGCDNVLDTPDKPTNLVATEEAGNIVRLTWDDNADNEQMYAIEMSPVGFDTYDRFKELVRIEENSNEYLCINIEPGEKYEFRIRALNSSGYSEYSNIDSIRTTSGVSYKPAVPEDLKVDYVSESIISVSWTDKSSRESGFVLEYKLANSAEFTNRVYCDVNAVSATLKGLNSNASYDFRVRSYNDFDSSDYSNTIRVSTLTVGYGKEKEFNTDFEVYPNPAQEFVYIKTPGNTGLWAMSLINTKGERIISNLYIPDDVFQLYVNSIPKGVYILKVSDGVSFYVKKLMIR
jgi:hypothetical protein